MIIIIIIEKKTAHGVDYVMLCVFPWQPKLGYFFQSSVCEFEKEPLDLTYE